MNKKMGAKNNYSNSALIVGIFLADSLLFFSLISKIFGVFNGITNLFLNLFQEFGYDLNFIGILIGIICAFVFGFALSYWYLWTKKLFVKE